MVIYISLIYTDTNTYRFSRFSLLALPLALPSVEGAPPPSSLELAKGRSPRTPSGRAPSGGESQRLRSPASSVDSPPLPSVEPAKRVSLGARAKREGAPPPSSLELRERERERGSRQSRLKSVILLNLSELFKIKNRIVEEVLFSHLFLLTKEKYYKSLTF
jgi:hypothetical protein